jgi:hypothetical protein
VSTVGSKISLISVFLFVCILLELFYCKRPFGESWDRGQQPNRLPFNQIWWDRTGPVSQELGTGSESKLGVRKDAPVPYQLTFQDPATPAMEGIIDLHHEILFYVIIVLTFILWMLARLVMLFGEGEIPYDNITHNSSLEWV